MMVLGSNGLLARLWDRVAKDNKAVPYYAPIWHLLCLRSSVISHGCRSKAQSVPPPGTATEVLTLRPQRGRGRIRVLLP